MIDSKVSGRSRSVTGWLIGRCGGCSRPRWLERGVVARRGRLPRQRLVDGLDQPPPRLEQRRASRSGWPLRAGRSSRTLRLALRAPRQGPGLRPAARVRPARHHGRDLVRRPDWGPVALPPTRLIDYPDIEVSRAYTRHVTDKVVRNGVIGRQLARLALDAGFAVPTVVPVTSVFRDVLAADQVLGLQRNTERAVAAGYLSALASKGWLDHLATGPFFATVTLYVVVADATL